MARIIPFSSLEENVPSVKAQGALVLAGGCFDILHEGHKIFLENAKQQGETLVILLESDEAIKRRKGENRPINTQNKRAEALSKLPFVDVIIPIPLFESNSDYYKLTKQVKPDIIAVTENDPLLTIKKDQAKMVGGKVIAVTPRISNLSTTSIIEQSKI